PTAPLPDGPVPPDGFSLGGVLFDGFSYLEARLLEYLWGKAAVPIQEVIEHVYGHDADNKDGALKSLVKHLSTKLTHKSCPMEVRQKSGHLILTAFNRG